MDISHIAPCWHLWRSMPEQHDIALCGAGGITHDEQQDFRPVRFGERGQWLVRVTPVLQLFGFVRFFIVHLIIHVRVCEIFWTVHFLHFLHFSGGSSLPLCRELHPPFQQDGMQCPDGHLHAGW